MADDIITIDGSMGEGGGQILRAALALSMALGRPFRLENIRANREKPGLRRQHLLCVQAARELCGADVEGDALGSPALSFAPGPLKALRSLPVRFDRSIGPGEGIAFIADKMARLSHARAGA